MFEKQLNKSGCKTLWWCWQKIGKLTIKNQLRQNGRKATKLKSLIKLNGARQST
jgi:hypothetical protein